MMEIGRIDATDWAQKRRRHWNLYVTSDRNRTGFLMKPIEKKHNKRGKLNDDTTDNKQLQWT